MTREAPLRVDWLPSDRLGVAGGPRAGRLGLTFMPGKHGPSLRYPGRIYRRSLDGDLRALLDAGVRRLLLLVEDAELARWGDPNLVDRAAAAGLQVERRPIPDGHPPGSMAAMDEVVAWIGRARATGDVAVACMGGVGRTGTVAACALVASGADADAAIGLVREVRHPTAVETPEQGAFVRAYERHVRDGPDSR